MYIVMVTLLGKEISRERENKGKEKMNSKITNFENMWHLDQFSTLFLIST